MRLLAWLIYCWLAWLRDSGLLAGWLYRMGIAWGWLGWLHGACSIALLLARWGFFALLDCFIAWGFIAWLLAWLIACRRGRRREEGREHQQLFWLHGTTKSLQQTPTKNRTTNPTTNRSKRYRQIVTIRPNHEREPLSYRERRPIPLSSFTITLFIGLLEITRAWD